MANQELVKLDDIWVHYDDAPTLEGINLSVKSSGFLGIIGPNGGGKTTLLKVILGLVKPTHGRVSVMGGNPEHGRKFIGYIPQYNLFDPEFPISVFEVVLMGRYGRTGLFRHYREEDKKAAMTALKTVDMLDYKDRQIGRLSSGEQQRIFIARALATSPKLLLLDEPTTSIDPAMQVGFYELLDKLKHGMAIIMVSHDICAVSIYVDEIACLNHQLFYHGSKEVSAEDLAKTYQCPVQLIAHGFIPHRVLKEH
ncbi:MAG: ABC transporter ATP-binding protein [Dehalococcoidales bacterium]|jgi:zinc transport system ATP-binding protein|nr:ABC transporter ATP-binding protein [Dehalococcoidales bacterium]MDP7415906.1 ABC transporter ATP-binding protein [Dehalococcoidales bacterium]